MWIQTGVRVRKRLSWVLTSVTLTFDLWPWPFAWTSLLTMVITPENFMMIRWWEHGEKGVTDRRTDRRTENTICRAAWSQLKTTGHLFYVASKRRFFLSRVTLEFDRRPWKTIGYLSSICYFKICASFHNHWCIQTGVTVQKCPNWFKIDDFFSRVTLKFDGWPWKTIGHLSQATSSFMHHFIAMYEFKVELRSENG